MNTKATDERYDKGMINYISCFFLSNGNITSECIRLLLSSIILCRNTSFYLLSDIKIRKLTKVDFIFEERKKLTLIERCFQQ